MGAQAEASGPDLRAGIGLDEIAAKGTIGGRVGDSARRVAAPLAPCHHL